MFNDPKQKRQEEKNKEALFHQRLAELRNQHAQFPWSAGEMPSFDVPKEESKLFADREIEGPDVTDAELARRALLDLTSLSFNFRTFYKRLHYEIQRGRRYGRSLSVCLVAIDDLEQIYLNRGMEGKNAAIECAAKTLLSCIRDVDISGRCREDCFGIILPETPLAGAEVAAERLRTKMEQLIVPQTWQQGITITVSVGAGSFPDHGEYVEELFAQTVEALMTTMKRGGNSVGFAVRGS